MARVAAVKHTDALIAVVDDEASVRTMLVRALRLAGYQVAPFASGEEFLASLQTRRPACAVVDIHMPGLSGFEVASRLYAIGWRVPIIFITAGHSTALKRQAEAAGAICMLQKPFSTDTLLDALHGAVSHLGEDAT
jgi:FixJ family two-component response regulator